MAVKTCKPKTNEQGHSVFTLSGGQTVVFRAPLGRDVVALEKLSETLGTKTEVTAALVALLMVSWCDSPALTQDSLLDLPLTLFKEVADCLDFFQALM